MTIAEWINQSTAALKAAGVSSARLDTEIILAHTLRKSRTYLHAHHDDAISPREHEIADARLQLRLDRTPIAYIIGHKEFYGRLFRVTPATLVPRPESEMMITILKEFMATENISLLGDTPARLTDVGTGSGCLGITAKLELPELDVTLLDVSRHALNVAKTNANRLGADVSIMQSNLLAQYPHSPNYILANLPYVDPDWERSPETEHEPAIALFAADHGLYLIKNLIKQASTRLQPGGVLILEADPRQHDQIRTFAKNVGLHRSSSRDFVVSLQL
jgi:release factor glutamine methyltransferase